VILVPSRAGLRPPSLHFLFLRNLKILHRDLTRSLRDRSQDNRRRENARLAWFNLLRGKWRFSVSSLVLPTAHPFHLVK
jgi:hypothetical protein